MLWFYTTPVMTEMRVTKTSRSWWGLVVFITPYNMIGHSVKSPWDIRVVILAHKMIFGTPITFIAFGDETRPKAIDLCNWIREAGSATADDNSSIMNYLPT
jgi:hypothetical protein